MIVLVTMRAIPSPRNAVSSDGGSTKFGGAPVGFGARGTFERSKFQVDMMPVVSRTLRYKVLVRSCRPGLIRVEFGLVLELYIRIDGAIWPISIVGV